MHTTTHFCLCFHLEVILVKATFCLGLSGPPPSSLTLTIPSFNGAVPVSDTPVPLLEQLVPRNLVGVNVQFDQVKVPREERVELDQTCGIYLKRFEVCAISALGSTSTSDDGFDAKDGVSSTSGFDLRTMLYIGESRGQI